MKECLFFFNCLVTPITDIAAELFMLSFVFGTECAAPIPMRKSIIAFSPLSIVPGALWKIGMCQEVSRKPLSLLIIYQICHSFLTFLSKCFCPFYFSLWVPGSPFYNGLPLCNWHIDWYLEGLSFSFWVLPLLLISHTVSKKMVTCFNFLFSWAW